MQVQLLLDELADRPDYEMRCRNDGTDSHSHRGPFALRIFDGKRVIELVGALRLDRESFEVVDASGVVRVMKRERDGAGSRIEGKDGHREVARVMVWPMEIGGDGVADGA